MQVIVKKTFGGTDGSSTVEESHEEVNHERHALNLAGKIARIPGVERVEIQEIHGLFTARAVQTEKGVIQELLSSRTRNILRKTQYRPHKKTRFRMTVMTWLPLFGLVGFVVSKVANSKDAGLAASTVCLAVALLSVVVRYVNRKHG
jgi:hypothetical protein